MANNLYTTKTAALRATKADINKIDAKKMLLNGKNILDYISDSEFNSYDTRDPQLKNDELDIWNTKISLSEEGHIEVKPLEHTLGSIISNTRKSTLYKAAKIINNEVLDTNNNHLMYWQTGGLTDTSDFKIDPGRPLLGSGVYLTTFNSDLSSLTNGKKMFSNLEYFESFRSNLSSLTNGTQMFIRCENLTTFSSDLSNLTNGTDMFSLCSNLTSFSADSSGSPVNLSRLTEGSMMFYDCRKLTSFFSNLSSLTNGNNMFYGCKLDAQSVSNIVHSLPTHETNGTIYIGIGCNATVEDQLLFTQECDCDTWQELLDEFSAKNWTVSFSFNGRPTTTYNMRRGETLPIYAKLEEVTEGEHYAYTSADGSKFYNINYFHSTNGSTEGYDVFSSLEEAISTYNVTPKN